MGRVRPRQEDTLKREPLFGKIDQKNNGVKLADPIRAGSPNIDAENMETFLNELMDMTKQLQSRVRDRRLPRNVAHSLQGALHQWRATVISELRDAKKMDVRRILGQMATCRNIVENELAPSLPPSPRLSTEINEVLQQLERKLRPQYMHVEATDNLRQLFRHVKTMKGIKDMIDAKLLIFGDWVGEWDNSSLAKCRVLQQLTAISGIWQSNLRVA
ncbi:hypothetical protein H0H93_014364 [Arthromyces matolae]|nr:hypothetical protein H0H93_014364 [Arthromyces matolae]